jgi:hypothetical protein
VTRGLGKLVPDVKPIAILFINLLSTDFDVNLFDKGVADVIYPTETIRSRGGATYSGKSYLEVKAVNKITAARNRAGYAFAEIGSAINEISLIFIKELDCILSSSSNI